MKQIWLSKWTKVLLFLLCLVPFVHLLWRIYRSDLTANPIEFITHQTGDWTIRFLMITLAITPLRTILNQPQLIRFRRMFGLFAFFYACSHFATWFWLDKSFDVHEMWDDIVKRRFITVGMAGLLMMIPLAVTSTAGWIRRLGFRRWQLLHRLVYFSALAGVIHYYWLVKSDIRQPLLYAGILSILMLFRLAAAVKKKLTSSPRKPVPANI
jgi:methionine sulfoxide reductase heme-binding subunit